MSKHFLIVDDSLISRMMTKSIVGKLRPDWLVHEAASGSEAIAVCQSQPVDLVSMDYNMPGITGLDAALEIRQVRPHVRIAIMTANVQGSMQDKIQAQGFSFVAKPFTEDKGPLLLAALGE